MDDEPFFYTAGVFVPRIVTRLSIGGVTVVEAGIFRGYHDLVWVEIREGVQEIGLGAFYGCCNLERVNSPSSLRTIGKDAFWGCSSLSTMNLPEGLRRIGFRAFSFHSLEQITIPSSVVEIRAMAFANSEVLSKVTLAGEMVVVAGNAFFECQKLWNIKTPSQAIVVEDGEYGSSRAAVVKEGTIARVTWDRAQEPNRLILSSPYLASMSSTDVMRAKDAINRTIGGLPPGEGPLDPRLPDWIRARFLSLLSAHRRAITSILERALEPGVAGVISSFLPEVGEGAMTVGALARGMQNESSLLGNSGWSTIAAARSVGLRAAPTVCIH